MFDAAEDGGAILFFDEADALFGKRSEVKDSHDRYANIEINYLLQRMEAYRGLAILATNMKSALDHGASCAGCASSSISRSPGVAERQRDLAARVPAADADEATRLRAPGAASTWPAATSTTSRSTPRSSPRSAAPP